MRKEHKSLTVFLFLGMLLTVVFGVGMICSRNPGAFLPPHRYDYALESFLAFCRNWWIPAGLLGIPMFLVSLLLSLRQESREKQR